MSIYKEKYVIGCAFTHDSQSGIESVFLLNSKNNFTDYWVYSMNANPEVSNDFYELQLKGLSPGEYKYLAIARDFANNTKMPI